MISFSDDTQIVEANLHIVGNKSQEEPLILSNSPLTLNEELKEVMRNYFLSSFKSEILYHFVENEEGDNPVCNIIATIFDDPGLLHASSIDLAKYLYEQGIYPQIKSGDFYTVYFQDCSYKGETVDVIGLFKSENKDAFLKVNALEGRFSLSLEDGINLNKLDKGCLIFSSREEEGYIVSVIDHTNRSVEAQYWKDNFLSLQQRQDEYFQTQQVLSLCKSYITEELPQHFEVNKADQIDLLNKSVQFFKENDRFDIEDFSKEVMEQPEVIRSFNRYKDSYQTNEEVTIADSFAISENAVKKQSRVFKSVIKLDKNFHIYVHGNRELIEQGIDENGRKYYMIFYNEEN